MDSNITDTAVKPYDVMETFKADLRSGSGRAYLSRLALLAVVTLCYGLVVEYVHHTLAFMAVWVFLAVIIPYVYFKNIDRPDRVAFPLITFMIVNSAVILLAGGIHELAHHMTSDRSLWPEVATPLTAILAMFGLFLVILAHWLEKVLSLLVPRDRLWLLFITLVPGTVNNLFLLVLNHTTSRSRELSDIYVRYFWIIALVWFASTLAVAFFLKARTPGYCGKRIRDIIPLALLMNLSYVLLLMLALLNPESGDAGITTWPTSDYVLIVLLIFTVFTVSGAALAVVQGVVAHYAVRMYRTAKTGAGRH